ncbi:MAG: SAM-dependent methyltransferase, partial [Marivirga sp.]|nr:SAM-dependent methyltransferase [Marivirga sp.]
MILPELLSSETQAFIRQNELVDHRELVLKYNKIHGVPIALIAEQVIGKRKAKEKIPTFYGTDKIVYPPATNMEQCSSETTALFKCSILTEELRETSTFADLTGGFGVDSYFFSQVFNRGFYVEPDAGLLEIAQHNHQQLKARGINYVNTTAEKFLSTSDLAFDYIYIDPSRRDKDNKKVSSLGDCEPNVIELVGNIFNKTNLLLIKASPLLDIQHAIKELPWIKKVFVVSSDNEC